MKFLLHVASDDRRIMYKCYNSKLFSLEIRPKFFFVMLPSPDQNLKIGSVGRLFFFFFFFFFELSFPIFF